MSCNGDALTGRWDASWVSTRWHFFSASSLVFSVSVFFFTSLYTLYIYIYICMEGSVCMLFFTTSSHFYCKCRPRRLRLLKFQPAEHLVWSRIARWFFSFFFLHPRFKGGLSWPPTRYFIAEKCNHKTFKAPPMQFSDKRKDKLGEETRLGNRERILSYEDLLEFFRH